MVVKCGPIVVLSRSGCFLYVWSVYVSEVIERALDQRAHCLTLFARGWD